MHMALQLSHTQLHEDVWWSELAQHARVAHSIHLADDYLGLVR